jgi:hypothetical protein
MAASAPATSHASVRPAHFQPAYVNQMVAYYRGLLGQLDPAVADLIAHANAERIAPFGPSAVRADRRVRSRAVRASP